MKNKKTYNKFNTSHKLGNKNGLFIKNYNMKL